MTKYLAQPFAEYGDGYDDEDWRDDKENAIGRATELGYQSDEADPPIAVWTKEWDLVAIVFAGEVFEPRPTLHEVKDGHNVARAEATLSSDFGCAVSNLAIYHDGISFTVPDELSAYRVAHRYQHCKETRVREAPNVGLWLVQVYREVEDGSAS